MKVRIENLSFTKRSKLIMAQILALFGFVLLTGFEARAERIEGRFFYGKGSGNVTTTKYISFAKVEIWRYAPRALGVWAWGHDGDATTDAHGKISKNMPFVESGVIYAVRVFATNYAAVVWPVTISPIPFYREPTGPDGNPLNQTVNASSDVLTFDFTFNDWESKMNYNFAEIMRRGYDYASSHRDPTETDQIGQVNVQPKDMHWLDFEPYNSVNQTITVDTVTASEEIGVLHGYGLYLEDKIGNLFFTLASHDGCRADIAGVTVNSAEDAWREGFADYFAQAVAASLPSGTLTGEIGTIPLSTLENLSPNCNVAPADKMEINVGATLWDLFDGPGYDIEPADFISTQGDYVFQIFDKELDHLGRAPTIWDFYNAWASRGLDVAGLNRILSRNRIISLPAQTSECLQMNAPTLMFPGQTYNVTVVMRNTGETKWTSAGNYFLGSQNPQDNQNFQRSRVPLPNTVPPGGQAVFNFTVTAPSAAGIYPLQFRMVQEWVEWFGNFTPSLNVEVRKLRLEVVPVSKTSTTETVRVNAYDYATGAPVQGTVTSTVTSPASTGTNITFTRPWFNDCTDVAGGRIVCHREYLQVVFTVTANGYGSMSIWY